MAAAPKRTKMDCVAYRDGMARASKSAGVTLTMKAGSWGEIPAALRALPPGAEMCGSVDPTSVVIVSPLFGKDLEAHYAPLFGKVGCQPFTCDVGALTICTCASNKTRGRVQTDVGNEAFSLLFTAPKGKN